MLSRTGTVKLIDFGLAHVYPDAKIAAMTTPLDTARMLTLSCGSLCYAAPELLSGGKYDGMQADVWSLAVCIFALFAGYLPVHQATRKDKIFCRILSAQKRQRFTVLDIPRWYRLDKSSQMPSDMADLLNGMLSIQPVNRSTMKHVQNHHWSMHVRRC